MNTREKLGDCPLFYGLSGTELDRVISSDGVKNIKWSKGDCMEADTGIYVICSGKLRVYKKEGGHELFLKNLLPGESFGYTKLFLGGGFRQVTLLLAKEKTEMIFIPEDTVRELIFSLPAFAVNIISIQSEKIRFLNKKIDSFTSPTIESRLFKYLSSCKIEQDGRVILQESMAELARKLDVGRASLYRAFDCLEKNGEISKRDGSIYIVKKSGGLG